jgi:beta-galactosidase
MHRVTSRLATGGRSLAFGGDYNPEQWPESVWAEDVALMREAGVNLVSVAIFSWALLEPKEGVYEFGWLDRILDLLHANGIRVDLANATASPPPWFSHRYPQSLPMTADGVRHSYGSRQAFCASSQDYRRVAAALTAAVADRYADHPAVVMWHVHNEYGCHNQPCYCDASAAGFRRWLQRRYATLDELNEAWGTAFWSQHYWDWDEIIPPRTSGTHVNPTQQLDFARFSSDELLDCSTAEAAILRSRSDLPITTNFMGYSMGLTKPVDYWRWAEQMDLISNDHYLLAEDPENYQDLAMVADLTRGWSYGRPWLLMEHSTSAVNWQPRNIAKVPGEMLRNSLQHVARGADGALFFQWRAAKAGAEKFHSAMLPHAGTDTEVWREVCRLGATLKAIGEVCDSTVDGVQVAILHDTDARWAAELDSHPSTDVSTIAETRNWHNAFWRANITTDLRQSTDDLASYKLVIAPVQYLITDAGAANLREYVEAGGHLVVTYFSGIVDVNDHIRLGGYPGAFAEVLGTTVEEFFPLHRSELVDLDRYGSAAIWSERVREGAAEVRARFASGTLAGSPAVTRNDFGAGQAYYVATSLQPAALAELVAELTAAAGVAPVVTGVPAGVEVVRRRSDQGSWTFVINHTAEAATLPVTGHELIGDVAVETSLMVTAGSVAVLRHGHRA